MNIHLAIYDNKNAGIVSAALHLKPDQVILLHRKEHDIEGIKSVLNGRGIKCNSQMVSFDPTQIRNIIQSIFSKHQDNNLIFNASSGFRIMVLVTLEQFTSQNKAAFVVDKFTNKLNWIHPSSRNSNQVSTHLKINEYVKFFAAQVISKGQTNKEPKKRQELTQWLISHIDEFGASLGILNYIAMKAEFSLQFQMDNKQFRNQKLQHVISKLAEVGILRQEYDTITFKDEESRFYANGGWLENHVFSVLYKIKAKRAEVSDLSKGMELVKLQGKVKNEIDVIAMANNRLHLIECKTRKFTKFSDANTPGAAAIYRLDTLKESFGGNSGKAMLVSYQKLSRYTEQRAKDLGIYCCSFHQLKQLEHHLYQFIDSEL